MQSDYNHEKNSNLLSSSRWPPSHSERKNKKQEEKYVCWWLSVSPDTETDPTSRWYAVWLQPWPVHCNIGLLQVESIECQKDHQIDRFEHLEVWLSQMKKNEVNKKLWGYHTEKLTSILNTFLTRRVHLLPGNQPIQHIFVRRQIWKPRNFIKQIRLIFDVWHSQHKAGLENSCGENSIMLISRPLSRHQICQKANRVMIKTLGQYFKHLKLDERRPSHHRDPCQLDLSWLPASKNSVKAV